MVAIKDFEMPNNCEGCSLNCVSHKWRHYCAVTTYQIDLDEENRDVECPLVEAIPKDQYEARLKADLEAILVELQLEIHELENPYSHDINNLLPLAQHNAFYDAKSTIEDLVDEKINELKENKDDK